MSKNFHVLGGTALGAVALLAAAALPASAAGSGDTVTTFNLAAGTLDITVARDAQLAKDNSGATSVSGSLGEARVTDTRGNTLGWTVSAVSSVFTNTAGTESQAVSYDSGEVATEGTVATKSAGPTELNNEEPRLLVEGVEVKGNNAGI